MAYLPGSLSTNHPPLTWRAVLHSQRAMLVSDHADAQQNDFASVFFHEAAPLPGDHKAFFPHNEAGTEVVKQKCAWHTTEVVSKKDYIHLWMGGNGSVSVEARKENKKQHSILFKWDVFAVKKLQSHHLMNSGFMLRIRCPTTVQRTIKSSRETSGSTCLLVLSRGRKLSRCTNASK